MPILEQHLNHLLPARELPCVYVMYIANFGLPHKATTDYTLQILFHLDGNSIERRARATGGCTNGSRPHVNLELFALFLLSCVFLTGLHHQNAEKTLKGKVAKL